MSSMAGWWDELHSRSAASLISGARGCRLRKSSISDSLRGLNAGGSG